MPRVKTIKKARKSPGACRKCGKVIEAGEGYRHWAFFRSSKIVRCMECPSPRPSELTESDKKSRLYAAQESVQDFASEHTDDVSNYASGVLGALQDASREAQEVADEYQDALDAWESGNEMLEEMQQAAEAWVDVLDNAAHEVDNIGEDDELDAVDAIEQIGSIAMDACSELEL